MKGKKIRILWDPLKKEDKITKMWGKIIYGYSQVGKGKARGVVEFLRIKNGLSPFPPKLRVLWKKVVDNKKNLQYSC